MERPHRLISGVRTIVNISGATGASYTIPVTAAADAGNYTVVATNTAGSITERGSEFGGW